MRTWQSLSYKIKNEKINNFYLLHGQEEYFIDQLSKLIVSKLLSPTEQKTNLENYYGNELNTSQLIDSIMQQSLFGGKKVIVIKEAQNLKILKDSSSTQKIKLLETALKSTQNSDTFVVFCHKNGLVRRNSKLYNIFQKSGIIFDALPIKNFEVTKFIDYYLSTKHRNISSRASYLLAERVGSNIKIIVNELDKLLVFNETECINEEDVYKCIGIHKDYNVFELQKALSSNDHVKTAILFNYFEEHFDRSSDLISFIGFLVSYYMKVIRISTCIQLKDSEIAKRTKIPTYYIDEYKQAVSNNNFSKLTQKIQALKKADLATKGVGNTLNAKEILRNLYIELSA